MRSKKLILLELVLRNCGRGNIQDVRRFTRRQSLRVTRAFVSWEGVTDEPPIRGTEESTFNTCFGLKDLGCNRRERLLLWRVRPVSRRRRQSW